MNISVKDYNNEFKSKLNVYCELLMEKFNKELVIFTSKNVTKAFLKVLNHFNDNSQKGFDLFYERLGYRKVRSPQYLAAGLLLIFLKKQKFNISQKKIASILSLNAPSLQIIISRLKDILKEIKGFEFVYNLININKLDSSEYLDIIKDNLYRVTNNLFKGLETIKLEISTLLGLMEEIINNINGKNKFSIFKSKMERITPIYVASSLCYLYLKYKLDYKIYKENFISKIKLNLKKSTFNTVSNQLESLFIKYCKIPYKEKVTFYIRQCIEEFRDWIKTNIQIIHKRDTYIKELENNSLINFIQYLYSKAISNGFLIHEIFQQKTISYYFPQEMALSLFYYSLKKNELLRKFASVKKMSQFVSIDLDFYSHIADKTSNRIYQFLKEELGHYEGQVYTRKTFIEMMEKKIRNFYHLETDFLLRLFKATDFSPKSFGENLLIHNTPGTSGVLRIIKKKMNFTEPQTFRKITIFIDQFVKKGEKRRELIKMLTEIKKSRSKNFLHQGVTYRFNFILNRIKKLNSKIARLLTNFFIKIWEEDFPRDIFLDGNNPRASTLKLLGSYGENVKTEEIENFFNPFLNYTSSKYYLCHYVQEVYNIFRRNRYGRKPKHPPILSHIIINEKSCIGSEVPVWLNITRKFVVGHVDLILINSIEIIIADYKQNRSEILKSLPQITAYALFLKKILSKFNDSSINIKIKCIGFSRKYAIIFDPFIIKNKILEFIKVWNHNHSHNLTTRKYSQRIGKFDLYDLWKDIISS